MSRATLYRYLLNGLIPAVQFKGKTKIRRSSLEKIFDTPKQYQKHTKSPRSPITDFYTTAEVASKYGVNESWIFKVGKNKIYPKFSREEKHTGVQSILINILHLKHRTPTLRNGIL
jgi:hypothetical protein